MTTLFFGGGTPSLFPPEFFARLLPQLYAFFPPEPGLELTLEANPGSIDRARLEGYRHLGFNRISFGVQSLNPQHLKTLTRIHGREEALEAVHLAQSAGFERISIDLMFGIPGQTIEGWTAELTEALALQLEHLSIYNLTPEEGTALVRQLELGRMFMPDEAVLVEMYRLTRGMARAAGYEPYEISNYHRPSASRETRCRHNLCYWTGGDYLGLGAGAHSYSSEGHLPESLRDREGWHAATPGDAARWSTQEELDAWQQPAMKGEPPIATWEYISPAEQVSEQLLTRLRLREGVPWSALEPVGGKVTRKAVEARALQLAGRGLVEVDEQGVRLTEEGLLLENTVIEALALAADEAMRVRGAGVRSSPSSP